MQATIYIRKENQERWGAISDKSGWINSMLEESAPTKSIMEAGNEAPYPASETFSGKATGHDDRAKSEVKVSKGVSTPIIAQPTPVKEEKTYEFCKHGNVKGMCKQGCK